VPAQRTILMSGGQAGRRPPPRPARREEVPVAVSESPDGAEAAPTPGAGGETPEARR